MSKSILYSLSLLLLFLISACSENTIEPQLFGTISGEVLTEDGLTPVAQASISTTPTTSSLITDENGKFELESVLVGTYTIRAQKDGFVPKLEGVNVINDKTTSIVIRLAKDTVINNSPEPPFDPMPMEGEKEIGVDVLLEWTATDPDEEDVLRYDVELFEEGLSEGTLVADGVTDNFVELSNLKYNTTYFWQVAVKDGKNETIYGEIWSFKTVEFPNNRFLFVREVDGKYDIYSSDETGLAIQLTNNSGSNWRPRMSPNRNEIAYISSIGIEPHLYIMKPDGSDPYQVVNLPISGVNNFELDFAWSPDGTQLLFMNNAHLYKVNKDGSGLTPIAETPTGLTFTECDWTAQGNKIIARTTGDAPYKSQIFILSGDGTFETQIVLDDPGSIGGGVFSINGAKLLYTQDISGFENSSGRQLDARVIEKNINSGVAVDLSFNKLNGTNDLDARYSPDGAKIIFTNTNNDGISPKSIWMMDVDGESRKLLFENAEMPDWR